MEVHECTDKIRITDDGEAYYGITKKAAIAEASRCLHCPKPRCQIGCPNHINIPEFVFEIANGNIAEAAKELHEKNLSFSEAAAHELEVMEAALAITGARSTISPSAASTSKAAK